MSQSTQAHTLTIRIQLDTSGDALRYKIDQVTVAEGKVPTAQIHFDCLHCKTRYFVSPKIVVELEEIPDEKPRDVTKKPEFESCNSIEVLSDGGDEKENVEKEMLVASNDNVQQENEVNVLESGSSMEVLSDDGGDEEQDKGHEIPLVSYDGVKKERELNIPESGSSDELPSDDEKGADILQKDEHEMSPEVPIKNEENESPIQIQVLNLHPFIPLARIDADKKGQDQQKVQLQKRTSKPKRKRFTCDICKESIKTRSALVYHMNVFHLGVRFSCSECQVSFSAKNNLSKHKKLLHQMEIKGHRRPTESTHENQTFRCPQCDKDFSCKKSLQRHLSSHIM